MIVFEGRKDLLKLPAQTIVCPVNTVGTLGNGLACAFKVRWPHLLPIYKADCRAGRLREGVCTVAPINDDVQCLFFPSKLDWRNDSDAGMIDSALADIWFRYDLLNIQSLALPMVGCGKGKMDYHYVRRSMDLYLASLPIEVQICLM